MRCPRCGSENVKIEMVQTGGKTKKHGNGIGGHINNTMRGFAGLFTLGLSNIVWKKSTGNEKIEYRNEKMGVCQDCGHSWGIR